MTSFCRQNVADRGHLSETECCRHILVCVSYRQDCSLATADSRLSNNELTCSADSDCSALCLQSGRNHDVIHCPITTTSLQDAEYTAIQ